MTMTNLSASLLVPLAALVVSANDAPIRVKLSDDVFISGDHARVGVRMDKDGYLLVLRMDSDGHVRVLFPVDPGDNAMVKGRRDIEIHDRGGRDAFVVTEKSGAGFVFAARSDKPWDFGPFMTGQHWNFDALVPPKDSSDPEAALLSLVDRMGDGKYDYDALPYKVVEHGRRPGYGYYGGWYDPTWYPVFYSPWPWFGPRVGFGATVVIPIRPFHGRRW